VHVDTTPINAGATQNQVRRKVNQPCSARARTSEERCRLQGNRAPDERPRHIEEIQAGGERREGSAPRRQRCAQRVVTPRQHAAQCQQRRGCICGSV